jgi:hypothetical protein
LSLERLKKVLADIGCINANYDEIEMLVESALPLQEIESYLAILAEHLIKVEIYGKMTASWETSIVNSVTNIQKKNRRFRKKKPLSYYIDFDTMQELLKGEWIRVLNKVVKDSKKQWTLELLKKRVKFNTIWGQIEDQLKLAYSNATKQLKSD